ncbi:unnamed protein product, partial [Rotaria sp. Silwood1]
SLDEVQTYEFRVAVINDVELEIPSKPTKAQKAEVPMYPADTLDQPKVQKKIMKDSITLSWKKTQEMMVIVELLVILLKNDHLVG